MIASRLITERLMALRRLASLLLLIIACVPAQAQVPAGAEVELIVFRLLDQRGVTPEAPGSLTPADAADRLPPMAFPALAAGSLQMSDLVGQLRRGGRHEVLWHGGWTQPLTGEREAVAGGLPHEMAARGVTGQVTLYRERFAHAAVDLQLQSSAGMGWRLQQSRRLRGRGPHYFDHPQVGLILMVRAPGPAEAAPTP